MYTHKNICIYTNKQKNAYNSLRMRSTYKKQKYISINIHFSNNYEKFKSKGSGWALTFAFVPIAWYEKGTDFLC